MYFKNVETTNFMLNYAGVELEMSYKMGRNNIEKYNVWPNRSFYVKLSGCRVNEILSSG